MTIRLLPGDRAAADPERALTLGVMGGGQLGRMFVHAAQQLGFRTAVLDPDATSPAGLVAHAHVQAEYLDEAGLQALADTADAITTEFENVPAEALRRLAERRPVAPHAVIADEATLAAVSDDLLPGILKTARLGYDGKGQIRVADRAALAAGWAELGRVTCVLEKRLPLAFEVSVIVARGRDGRVVAFPLQQNLHRDGILAVTTVPAPAGTPALEAEAIGCAARIAADLGYVGVLCIEFFILEDGSLVANEMAPRPHNSGHHTIDSCDLSQFDLQVRAMAGLPLAKPRLHSPTVMLNLLGDLWFDAAGAERTPDWAAVLALPGANLHLYGKESARRGRKMGHLTITGATPAAARETALQAAALLGIEPF